MLMTYSKPMLIDSGNSSEIIKGECGWGGELPFFDAKGSVKSSHTVRKYVAQSCPGPGVVTVCHICSYRTVSCSSEESDC